MYLGATTWTFSWAPPYDDAIRRISDIGGFKSVELTIWGEEFLRDYYTKETNRYLADLAGDSGLKIADVFCIPEGIGSPKPNVRDKAVDYFKRVLDAARQLGADMVITLPPNPFELDIPYIGGKPMAQEWTYAIPRGLDWKKNWNDMISTFRQFADECDSRGMKVALEPHPWRMMHNAAGMMRIIDQIDSSAIGLNLDPSHLFPSGEIAHAVAYEVGDRVFSTHLSDNDGVTNAHWRPGKGRQDYRSLLIALHDIGYTGALSLELEDVPGAAGYPGFHRSPTSTDEIEREHAYARDFLVRICEEEGIPLEL